MESTAKTTAKRYPLHITISVAFAVLLALFGLALIGFNYLETRKIALLGADDLLARIDAHMQTSVEELYGPVENVVDVASKALPAHGRSPADGLRSLGFVSEVLRLMPEISSIFVGYENGDSYLLRHVDAWPGIRNEVNIPPGATFVLEIIRAGGPDGVHRQWELYDDDLTRVGLEAATWTGFDPREREWYKSAIVASGQIATDFYRFFTTREIGVTIARRLAAGTGVVGADLTLEELSAGLAAQKVTPSTRIAMLDRNGGVIALPDYVQEQAVGGAADAESVNMPHITELQDPVYHQLAKYFTEGELPSGRLELSADGRVWLASLSTLPTRWGEPIVLATLVPRDELLADAIRVRNNSIWMSIGLLLLTLAVVVALSRHIARSLRTLALEAQHIREFRLDTPLTVRSSIQEVDDLAETMGVMKSSLQQFLAISHALSAEKNFDRLLEMILEETRRVSGAEGGAILLRAEDASRLDVAILQRPTPPAADQKRPEGPGLGLDPADLAPDSPLGVERRSVEKGIVVRIDDTSVEHGYDLREVRARFDGSGAGVRSVLCVPLRTSQDEVIGVLQLVNAGQPQDLSAGFRDETVSYIEALSSDAAVALDNRRLLQAQKDLLESFIHVVAGAIDAKSPYTHGHCQRVPEVARMLAEEAHASQDGPFAGFELSEDEWYALHLASWLHDCGKVTTPEYVVDKASKLETLYNRIHEIRMRFEVLWRDAEIEHLEALRAGEADEATLRGRLEDRQARIRDDFEFIARCNTGDEPMSDEMIERVRRIGAQEWIRHLDDRVGLAHGELRAKAPAPDDSLPVAEPVLADRPEHRVPRADGGHPFGDNQHGFRMDVPEHLYNQGEIHNLCIRRGTLTAEERFKINEHVIQTIRMLGRLPFPRELRQVPDWAGNHHEKLDGTGYPRRLPADGLSVPERIMAMADIFEALTATDRPYMPPKTLSRAVGIMRSMCDSGHLCPDLFELFLRSGVYRRYAEQFLQPQQLDDVDVGALLGAERPMAS